MRIIYIELIEVRLETMFIVHYFSPTYSNQRIMNAHELVEYLVEYSLDDIYIL